MKQWSEGPNKQFAWPDKQSFLTRDDLEVALLGADRSRGAVSYQHGLQMPAVLMADGLGERRVMGNNMISCDGRYAEAASLLRTSRRQGKILM